MLDGNVYESKIAVITTAMLRPELLNITYKSFSEKIEDLDFSKMTLYLHIDDCIIEKEELFSEMLEVAYKYFKRVITLTGHCSYPKAVKRLYEAVDDSFEYVFDIQDDWILTDDIKISNVLGQYKKVKEGKNLNLVGVTLNTYQFLHEPYLFCMSPSIIEVSYIKAIYKHLNDDITPEQQIRRKITDKSLWIPDEFAAFTVKYPNNKKIIAKDIGRDWQEQHNIKKNDIKFTKWVAINQEKDEKYIDNLRSFTPKNIDDELYNYFFKPKNRNLKKIIIVTAVYKRYELTEYVLGYYEKMRELLKDYVELDMIVVGSEGEISRLPVVNRGFKYVEYANTPVSQKFNRGFLESKKYDPDGVLLIGSDDLIDYNTFMYYIDELDKDFDLIGFEDFYIYDIIKDKLYHWLGYINHRLGEPIGLGRFFSRKLLSVLDYNLWNDVHINSGLDGYVYRRLIGMGINIKVNKLDNINGMMVDVKTSENMWSAESLINNTSEIIEVGSKLLYKTVFDDIKKIKAR